MFIYLNNKSGYSFLESTLKIDQIIQVGIDNQMPSLSLTDHNNMFGVMEFYLKCKEKNIKPIIGMEVNLANSSAPLILLATSNVGYLNLCKITSLVSIGNFDYEVSLDNLDKYKEGLICILPYIRAKLENLSFDERVSFVNDIKRVFKAFYIGLESYKNEDTGMLYNARKLTTATNSLSVPIVDVITKDSSCLEAIDILRAVKNKTTVDALENIDFYNHHFVSESRIKNLFTEEEIKTSSQIASLCNVNLDEIKGSLYEYKVDDRFTQFEYLQALCQKGLEKRIGTVNDTYQNRLNYELSVIDKMGFVNYFLIVFDYVRFCKKNDILVGPGRGSAGGSLVAYSLGITNVDPIKYNLLFERFLNPERVSMPDIDVDFIDSKREQVFNYISEKYGKEYTARVVTFQTFKAKSSLKDVAKALGCSVTDADLLSKKLAKIKSDDLKELVEASPAVLSLIKTDDLYKRIYENSLIIEGLPRQTGLHAAGIVINNEPLINCLPIYNSYEDSNILVAQYDKDCIEKSSFLKMDILGLTTLSVLEDCRKSIKEQFNIDIDFNNIDFEDPNIYKVINSGNLAGIFQMDQAGMGRAVSIVKPQCFEDAVAVLALGRPGPMQFLQTYKDRKDGKERVNYLHPSLEPILKPTYGIIVYQEQIMQILTKMAGFSLGKADLVRRAISKKKEDLLVSTKKEFIQGCLKNGYNEKESSDTFETILKFANYGFNRSHSVAYAMIACATAYLKYYYPQAFYTSILNVFGDDDKIANYFVEMKRNKITILPPSINYSSQEFICNKNEVIFALNKIKEVSPTTSSIIIEERKKGLYKDFIDFAVRTNKLGINSKVMTALIEAGCFDEFKTNRTTLLANLENILMYADIVSTKNGDEIVIDLSSSSKPLIQQREDNKIDVLMQEKDRTGLYLSGFPLETDRERISNAGYLTVSNIVDVGKIYKTVLFINKVKSIRTKKGTNMAILDCEDETGKLSVTVFPEQYAMYEQLLRKNNYIQVKGKLDQRDDNYQLIASLIKTYNLKEENNNESNIN